MADTVSKVIFQLDIEAKEVFNELNKVAGKYRETTSEIQKQGDELAKLQKKEADLLAARGKAQNPSAVVKINKELKATQDLIAKEITLTKTLTKELEKQEKEADRLGTKMEAAFESSIINSAATAVKGLTKESEKLTTATETNAQELKRLNRELQELEPGSEEFIKLAKRAGEVKDKIKTAADNVAVFSAASKATQAKNLFGQIAADLADLNFADAATKAKTFASVVNSITFDEVVKGAKEFGSTMANVGKSLLANPLVLFSAAIAGLTYAIYSLVSAYQSLGEISKSVDAAIEESSKRIVELTNRRIEATIKLNEALGKIDSKEAQRQLKQIKDQEELLALRKKFAEELLKIAQKSEIDLTKLRNGRADESGAVFADGRVVGTSDLVKQRAIEFNKAFNRLTQQFNKERSEILKTQATEELLIETDKQKKFISLEKEIQDTRVALIIDERQRQIAEINLASARKVEAIKKVGKDEVKNAKEISDLLVLEEKLRLKRIADLEDGFLKARQLERTQAEKDAIAKRQEIRVDTRPLEDPDTRDKDQRRREELANELSNINIIVQATAQAAEDIIAIEIKKQDALLEIQNKRVQQAAQIAERGNAEVLQQEQERLDAIQKKREQFVRAQQILQQVEIVGNSIVAVSKAAAQGGVAAPATIAATIAALIAGFSLVRTLTQPEGFREGGYTGDGDPSQESKRLGNRGYKYHKKEFVFNERLTKENLPTFRKIHEGQIDLNDVMNKAKLFEAIPMPILNNLLVGQHMRNAQSSVDVSRMEDLLAEIKTTIRNKPEATMNINENGFRKYMKEVFYIDERIRNAAR